MQRNSRWTDDPRLSHDGKPVIVTLTSHDIELFAAYYRHGMVRTNFLHALVGGYYDAVRKRVDLLRRKPNSYLRVPEAMRGRPNRNYQNLAMELAGRGWTALEQHGHNTQHKRVVLNPGRGKYREFDHDLMTSDVMVSIELSARAHGLRFISWQEVLDRAPEQTKELNQPFRLELPITKTDTGKPRHIVPDAIFRLAYPRPDGGEYFQSFFVEIDRANMPAYRTDYSLSSLERKVVEYRELLDHQVPTTQIGIKNAHVLIISTDPKQIERIIARMQQTGLTDKRFHFLALPDYGRSDQTPKPMPELLGLPFRRAGHTDSYLRYPKFKPEGGDTPWTSTEPAGSLQKSRSAESNLPLSSA
jgi:hypothetical protein